MANDKQQMPEWLSNSNDNKGEMNLSDLYRVIPYQKKIFFGILLVLFLIGAAVVYSIPNSYSSSASIIMERGSTFGLSERMSRQPESLNIRLRTIMTTMLSTASVEPILTSLGLLSGGASEAELRGAAARFRGGVDFEFDNVKVLDDSGYIQNYSLGFTLKYTDAVPELAFAGTQELVNRLLAYSSDKVAERAESETEFLKGRMARAKERLDVAEDELADFKKANAKALPHMQSIHLRREEDVRNRLAGSKDRVVMLKDSLEQTELQLHQVALDTSIYSTTGQRITSPEDQLALLELEYSSLKNRYAPNHPDVVEKAEEIAALREHLGTSSGGGGLDTELALAEQELSVLRNRYSEKHPDIAAAEERVQRLKTLNRSGRSKSREQIGASNPLYASLQARKRSLNTELRLEQDVQAELRRQLLNTGDEMEQLPSVERDLRRLENYRDELEDKYSELREELAETRATLEERNAELMEKFVVLEAPVFPTGPSKPNRRLLLSGVGIFALLLAYLVVFLRHMMKDAILDSRDVETITSLPVYLIPKFD